MTEYVGHKEKHDTRILYCGGIFKIRCEKRSELDPYLLFALLNTPIVKSQMRTKQFTRDIIDTLGGRLFEIQLPIPKDESLTEMVSARMKSLIEKKEELREEQRIIPSKLQHG